MQTVTAQIKCNAGGIFVQPDIDSQIRRFTIHIRTRQIFAGKGIDNRILDLQRAVLAVTNGLVQAAKMDGKRSTRIKYLCPVDCLNAEVQIKIAVDLALSHRQDNARGQAAPHQALVNKPRVALKMDPTLNDLTLQRAEVFQFSF